MKVEDRGQLSVKMKKCENILSMNRWQERFKNPYSATVDSIFILD
jgi:hypothetical protein